MRLMIPLLILVLMVFKSFGQNEPKDAFLELKMKQREIPHAKIGDLICLNDYGKYVICTGNEFEKILGFCTNTPFITVNKAKGDDKITEHKGIASFENGRIKVGDYLCPCKKNSGQVIRCKKKNYPYAKTLEAPAGKGELFSVKILGHRRKF